jgi:thiol:disulfide interchange protein
MKLLTPLALLFSFVVTLQAEPEYPKMGADIYDTQVDGVTQIKQALAKAKAGHKHVLLDLGANWCIWCRRLTHTFETDASVAKTLDENFVLVLIDVNHRGGKHRNDLVNARYDNPTKEGLPVLVVLDADGVHLTTQETGALEDGQDAHDPAKVLAFLQQWAPKR